jgi:hypothetical protein
VKSLLVLCGIFPEGDVPMSVNPPSSDIPISSGEQIPQPPQRSIPSPYLPHVCTVSIARRAERAAAGITVIAGQDMRQASLTTVGEAQHTYDEHPEDKVRGKDSKAVAGALHDIASQHGGEGASGGVLGATGGSTISQQPIIEDSQSHTLDDVQESPTDAGEEFVFNEADLDSANSDMRSAESTSKERVPEASSTEAGRIDTSPEVSFNVSEEYPPEAIVEEFLHEAVHSGKVPEHLRPVLERGILNFAAEAKLVDKWYLPGLAARFVAKDQENEGLSSVETKILRQGYTLISENRGVHQDADGNVAVFSQGRMRATSGALKKKFLDTLPPAKRRLAEECIASGKVDTISPEELEEHRRAGAAIADRVYDRISSEYQTFKKEQLEKEREKRDKANADAKKNEDNAQLRRHGQTQHPSRGAPTLEDASKESQEKTTEKKEEKADPL